MALDKVIPEDIREMYEIHEYKFASSILANDYTEQFEEICEGLRAFRFKKSDVTSSGGSESNLPKKFKDAMRPHGWYLEAKLFSRSMVELKYKDYENNHFDQDFEINNASSHYVDYYKNQIAIDFEWNSKDQTYDRDLYAFRSFYDFGLISLGIIVTRSNELDDWFRSLGTYTDKHGEERAYMAKYGASTTNMRKLLDNRLYAGRSGGCPVLAFGITTKLLEEE